MSRTLSSARLLVWLLASTSGTLAACSRNAANSEVVVTIEAEPGVRAAAMLVVVRVFGGPHGADQPSLVLVQDVVIDVPPHNGWPLVIALAPLNRDPTRIYRVEALAYDVAPISDDVTMRPPPVATVRAVSGYAPGQTVLLSLLLQDSCLGHPCDEFQTCDRGTCAIARMIDPSTLPLAGDAGPRPDGGPGQDGGPGPDVGPGPDAGDGGRIGPDAAPPCTMASCNDGLSCTVDFCALDGCQHMPIAALCNDGVVCTDDLCNGTTGDGCTHPANTVACDDGVFCNGLDTCGGGTCSVHAFTLPATVCGALSCDGTRCTGCGATAPCPDPMVGSFGACSYASGCAESGTWSRTVRSFTCTTGSCVASDTTDIATCGARTTTGDVCTTPRCDTPGGCSLPSVCATAGTASQTCHDFACALGSCVDTPRGQTVACTGPPTEGNACDDGIGCTTSDHCTSGVCMGSGSCDASSPDAGGSCDDGFTCTNDTFVAMCMFTPVDSRCDDGNPCSTEFCDPTDVDHQPDSGCVRNYVACGPDAGPPRDTGVARCLTMPAICYDGNPCTTDTCSPGASGADPMTGCLHTPPGACGGLDAGGGPMGDSAT